jgi:hypothetical protein
MFQNSPQKSKSNFGSIACEHQSENCQHIISQIQMSVICKKGSSETAGNSSTKTRKHLTPLAIFGSTKHLQIWFGYSNAASF